MPDSSRSYRPLPPVWSETDLMARLRVKALGEVTRLRAEVLMAPVSMPTMWRALAQVDRAEMLVRRDLFTGYAALPYAVAAVGWGWKRAGVRGDIVPDNPLMWADRSPN
ncbi:hypothetical protein [Mycobacterium hubeiense]|uniref:hypothetical protein n=1 Tax=Mycobacterium hubeiense TaxID=1867256 RepID=UPI000C7ED494|nr:hypothetical protein [Mycobacterium sp. QGD 101]